MKTHKCRGKMARQIREVAWAVRGPSIAALAVVWWTGWAEAAQRAIVFDFELVDTSLEGEMNGPRADEQARLVRTSEQLRQRLAESGRFALVDGAPVAAAAHASNLQACGGCDAKLARQGGGDHAHPATQPTN